MPKARRMKFYAVRHGRQGARVYDSWDEAKGNVSRYPGAAHKSFTNRAQAEAWINVETPLQRTHLQGPPPGSMPPMAVAPGPMQSAHVTQAGPSCRPARSRRHDSEGINEPRCTSHERSSGIEPIAGPSRPSVVLSAEQREVLNMVHQGKNVFFTGSAGTGKSVLLRAIIESCEERHGRRPAVTATTGIASVNIGGCTIHSWAGIGLGSEKAYILAAKIMGKHKKLLREEREKLKEKGAMDWSDSDEEAGKKVPKCVDRWRSVKTLIIDEISMMDGVLFDKLEFIARAIRKDSRPFGGIQLVLSGDFCQLPPVADRAKGDMTFAFEAETWNTCVGKPVTLTRVFRQKEQRFIDMLNEIRFGRMSKDTTAAFRNLERPVVYDDDIEPTDLFPTRFEVDRANMSRLAKIPSSSQAWDSNDTLGLDENGVQVPTMRMEKLLERLVVPKQLVLKVGAQVMLVKNLVQGSLVNGSVGRVIAFSTPRDAVKQGAEVSLPKEAEGGKDQGGKDKDRVPDRLLTDQTPWPVVAFQNGMTILCVPADFEVNNAAGGVEARRTQVPLILAWALSIHKSQGQTLERVRVNLGRVFEKGQAYVALSRATNLNTLQVIGFDPSKVVAHPRVLAWMNKLDPPKRSFVEDEGDLTSSIDEDLEFWDDCL